MLYKFILDGCDEAEITATERNSLIRFCLSVGTRAKCSTRTIMRPFKQKYLIEALREVKAKHAKNIADYKEKIELYNSGKLRLPQSIIDYFEGVPTKEKYEAYLKELIWQERETMQHITNSYNICVDFFHIEKSLLDFHNSLNPRITFGYSNLLHEECDFILTDEIKRAFLNSSLKDLGEDERDWYYDWGYVHFQSGFDLSYEDLSVFCGERCILETVSHEQGMSVCLTDEEIAQFSNFEGKAGERAATIQKLKNLEKAQID